MDRDLRPYLSHIERAIGDVLEFAVGRSFDEIDKTPILRAAVERKLIIIGGTLEQIDLRYPEVATSFSYFPA